VKQGEQNHKMQRQDKLMHSIDDLYDRYYDELVLWADTILNDMGAAEDLVQDFFVRLWEKKLTEHLEETGIRSYLYVSVKNIAVRRLKGQKRIECLPDFIDIEKVWEETDSSREEIITRVLCELEKLPPRSREVLECVHLKNMKYAEVAEYLGISISTVKTLLVRSLKTLRESLSDFALLVFVLFCKEEK
jgi:RNA polymerase sigma factor, sigma-70 family